MYKYYERAQWARKKKKKRKKRKKGKAEGDRNLTTHRVVVRSEPRCKRVSKTGFGDDQKGIGEKEIPG